jgi:peptidoglycan/LPS O-acetylase OafA/YrhL
MKHITDLTCCRALFAGWVFAYHLNLQAHYASFIGPAGTFVEHGYLGVDGFFILSGMILAHAHPNLRPTLGDARQFWAKRLVRIYPVHIAMILALGAMLGTASLLGVHPREPGRFSVYELFSHLTLLHAWGMSDRWAWNYPSWSISAEWAGYLLFPVLWALLRRQNGTVLAIILPLTFVGVVATQQVAQAENLSLTYDGGLIRLFPEFIAGICIVPLLPRLWRRVRGRVLAAVGTAVVLGGALMGSASVTILGLWGVLAGLMLAGRQGSAPILGGIPGMVWLGEISYSYYMSFALVETLESTMWRHLGIVARQHPLLYVAATTAMTLAVATLSWWGVERPALRAFASYARRHTAMVEAAARG